MDTHTHTVLKIENIIPDTEEWLIRRAQNDQNSSSFSEQFIGHFYEEVTRRFIKYGNATKLVRYRKNSLGLDSIYMPEEEVTEVMKDIFGQGHEGEQFIFDNVEGMEQNSYYVITFEDDFRVGVTPDMMFAGIPVEVKTLSTYGVKEYYFPLKKWLHQMILQAIACGTNNSIWIRKERDVYKAEYIEWDCEQYIQDVNVFKNELKEDPRIYASKKLVLCEYWTHCTNFHGNLEGLQKWLLTLIPVNK